MEILEAKGIKKRLLGRTVLDGLSLKVNEGEIFVVMGRSGEGKSVLLKCIIGLMEMDEGQVFFKGQALDYEKPQQWRKKFGMLFQGGALFDSMTVYENIEFVLEHLTDWDRETRHERIREVISIVELEDFIEAYPSELSGGMKKRAALARTISYKPEIVLFDEPTTGLDPITTYNIDNFILKMRDKGELKAAIVVTHDVASAFRLANRIALLKKGKFVFYGDPKNWRESKDMVEFIEASKASG